MKIGITGEQGFIGGAVYKSLPAAGHTVTSLSSRTRVLAIEETNDSGPELDWILHFGAKTSIPESLKDPYATYAGNIGSTLAALRIARNSRAAFLFMSSYVYGQPRYLPIDENHPLEAANPYMGSKIVCEQICRQICSADNVPLIILRGFNIFGDHHIPGRLISDLIDCIRRGIPFVLNDALPKRDYLYIKDFVSLIHKIITKKPVPSGMYNVGYGKSYSNLEVARLACRFSGCESSLTIKNNPRPFDIMDCTVNVDLVKKTFSWQPEYTLEAALSEIITNKPHN